MALTFSRLPCPQDRLTIVRSPIDLAEAIKNPVEIEGMKRAYMRDGAAWVRWAAWLDELMKSGGEINEWDAAEELTKYRALGKYFNGLAYDNISATNENAGMSSSVYLIIARNADVTLAARSPVQHYLITLQPLCNRE